MRFEWLSVNQPNDCFLKQFYIWKSKAMRYWIQWLDLSVACPAPPAITARAGRTV